MTDVAGNEISIGDRVQLYFDSSYCPIKEVAELGTMRGEDIVIFSHDPFDWSFARSTLVAASVIEDINSTKTETTMIDTKKMIERVAAGEAPSNVLSELLGMRMSDRKSVPTGQPKIRPALLKRLSDFKRSRPKPPKAPWEK